MSDYDDVRTCCSGAQVCRKCWKLMAVAVKVLDRALRADFGFKHLLWVFSGRRGIHCWVCDDKARSLDTAGRTAVAEYLTLVRGGAEKLKKVSLPDNRPVHPLITESLKIIDAKFEEVCLVDQQLLESEAQWKAVLSLVTDEKLKQEMESQMGRQTGSETRWQAMEEVLDQLSSKKSSGRSLKNANCLKEIKLQYLYPRLDINVTKGFNHLLKSPFCVHPATSKVCVPFDPAKVDQFDPDAVPTVDRVIEEVCMKRNGVEDGGNVVVGEKEKSENVAGAGTGKAYKETSLRAAVEVFEDFVKKLELSWRGKLRELGDQKMDF